MTTPLGINHANTNAWSTPFPSFPWTGTGKSSICICKLPTHDEYRRVHSLDIYGNPMGFVHCIVPGCAGGIIPLPKPR